MISLEAGVALTIISYLVIVTSYIVGLRKDLNSLQQNFRSFEDHFDSLKQLREDFVRLETKIEVFLKMRRDEMSGS